MTRALDLSGDRRDGAELYSELSFEAALRAGMWRVRPRRDLVDGWIERALTLARSGEPARARAPDRRCGGQPLGSAAGGREASALAERLGDPALRSYAWDARGITFWAEGEPDLGRAWEERRFELLDQHRTTPTTSRTSTTRRFRLHLARLLRRGSPPRPSARRDHEPVDAAPPDPRARRPRRGRGARSAGWERSRPRGARRGDDPRRTSTRPASAARARSFVFALAAPSLGRARPGRVLEGHAAEFRMEGYGHVLDTPRLRLALSADRPGPGGALVADPFPDRGWHRAWLLLRRSRPGWTRSPRSGSGPSSRRGTAAAGDVPRAVPPPRARARARGRAAARALARGIRSPTFATACRRNPRRARLTTF